MHGLYLLSVWLHILAAAVWIGGMVFLALVLVPVTRRPEYRGVASTLVHWTGVRFRWVGWACLGLLVLSGVANVASRGYSWEDVTTGRLWRSPFGETLGLKLALVGAVLLLSAAHDFVIGLRATTVWRSSPDSPDAARLRRQAGWIGRLNLALALGVVALAVMLTRGLP